MAPTHLRKHMLLPSPFEQFRLWMDEARKKARMKNPNACCLCTAGGEGRMVLLKGADAAGLTFFTNYQSAKGRQLKADTRAELVFYWDRMGRQVRVKGRASKVSAAVSDAYFAGRPRASQIGAWASLQSREAASRAVMDERYLKYEEAFEGKPVPRPPHWGGFLLKPTRFEFWQGDPARFHDRFHYRPSKGGWKVTRIYP